MTGQVVRQPGARTPLRVREVLAVGFVVLLHFTTFGRGIYDIGLNHEAAHFSGVNVARSKLVVFVLTGLVSAFAGLDRMRAAEVGHAGRRTHAAEKAVALGEQHRRTVARRSRGRTPGSTPMRGRTTRPRPA